MTSTYTANKIYELQATGENPGTWGTLLNAVLSIIDLNFGGRLALDVAGSGDNTLSTTQERNAYILMTGVVTGNKSVVFTTTNGGFYLLDNRSTGSFTITAKYSGGTGVVIPQNGKCLVMVDPTNTRVVLIDTPNMLTTQGDILYQDANGAQRLAAGTAGQYLKTGGAAANPSWATLIPSGTLMLFQQTAAPTGWTKQTTHNDKGLRVVSGTASSGGSTAFSTVFAQSATGSSSPGVAAHTHTYSGFTGTEEANHNHGTEGGGSFRTNTGGANAVQLVAGTTNGIDTFTDIQSNSHTHAYSGTTDSGGSGSAHTHTVSLLLQYVDLIIASKD